MTAAGGGAGEAAGGGTGEAMARLEEALEERGLADPRPRYRELLKRLADEDREAYREAVRRFEEELVPGVARGEEEPAVAWVRYGLGLAPELIEGRPVGVDETGLARTVEEPADPPLDRLLLWVPEDAAEPAVVLSRPADLSDPQQATVELLA